jgi:hypothetical protein
MDRSIDLTKSGWEHSLETSLERLEVEVAPRRALDDRKKAVYLRLVSASARIAPSTTLPARIEEFQFARPTPQLASRFAEVMAPMLTLGDMLEQKNTNLRTTRDLLLPKLISGELDVSALPEPEAVTA